MYAKHSEAFSPLQAKVFLRIAKHSFVFCDGIVSIRNISANSSMQWMNKIWL